MTTYTALPSTVAPDSASARAQRPVLAREADSTYWMSRYVERTENVARLLLASLECMIDVRDVAPALLEKQWRSVLRIMNVDEPAPAAPSAGTFADRVASHMTFGEDNPSSLVACLTRARENARGNREGISSDMWEHLNRHYWSIRSQDARALFLESPHELFKECISGAMTFQGLTDQTLPHDQRWHFAQLGKYFERITFTCRVLQDESGMLRAGAADAPFRNLHWATVLRSCNSHEAHRRANPGEMQPVTIAVFLLLDASFPRSVRHCVRMAKESISAISAEVRPRAVEPAERILGRLQAQLEYADADEFLAADDLAARFDDLIRQTALAALAVQKAYFLH
jgi:uncharacterized alpha-E superfamily protein